MFAPSSSSSNCSQAFDEMFIVDTTEIPTTTTPAVNAIVTEEQHVQEHWFIGDIDVPSAFVSYRRRSSQIAKPLPLEQNVQEVLALSDVLFLANDQDSDLKASAFGEDNLKIMAKHQLDILKSQIPSTESNNFTSDEYTELIRVVNNIDDGSDDDYWQSKLSPKSVKLQLLNAAAKMDHYKGQVIEGIADMLVKLPPSAIKDKNSFGEVDVQTRYYDPLLSSMFADQKRKVALRWPNKEDELTKSIRPDAIISSIVQRAFGQSLGFGEVKPGDDSTTLHSLSVDTVKLAVLSRKSDVRYEGTVFRIKGYKVISLYTQMMNGGICEVNKEDNEPLVKFSKVIGDDKQLLPNQARNE